MDNASAAQDGMSAAKRADERTTPAPTNAREWKAEIARAEHDMDMWRQRCKRIRDRYRYEQAKQTRRRRFQILWANLETLRPAVYSKGPKPVVENRWKNDNPTAHTAAEMMERNISFQFELCNYHRAFKLVRDDYLSFARGAARFRYEPIWNEAEIGGGGEKDNVVERNVEGGVESPQEDDWTLKTENCRFEYIGRDDLIHPRCRVWEELPWLGFRSFLTRDELIGRFGKKKASTVTMDSRGADNAYDYDDRSTKSGPDKATTYEIWDKARRRCIWICKSGNEIMDEGDPYLKLDGFFPCPRPAYGTLTNDTLEPVPDFVYYQDQSEEIDDLTARIASLQDSLKLVGFYPLGPEGEGSPEIERAVKPGFENKMIGVKAWTIFQEAGRGGAPIIWLPVEQVSKVLEACISLRKQLIDDVHEITGVSDLMRADSDPEETATAQNKKQNWSISRLKDRRDEMARFCRDATRMAGEIIANHFQIATMMQCADMPIPSAAEVRIQELQAALAAQRAAMQAPPMGAPPPMGPPPAGNVVPFPGPQMAGATPAPPGAPAPPGPPAAAAGAPTLPPGLPPPNMPPSATPPGVQPASPAGGGMLPPSAPGGPPPPSTGPPYMPTQEAVLALYRDGVTRRFRLDIETDSTVEADDDEERNDRIQFLQATTQMVTGWLPVLKELPEAVPLAGALMKFGANGFPVARELFGEIDRFVDVLAAKAQQPPPPPPIPPEAQAKIQVEQIKAQSEQARGQIDIRATQVRAQAEAAKAQMGVAAAAEDHRQNVEAMQLDRQATFEDHNLKMQQAAVKQKTLADQVALAEQRKAAQQAVAFMQPGPLTR
jgi:hypothetical protein